MDSVEGDPAAFDAVLAAVPPEHWTELRAALDAVEAAGPPYADWPRHDPGPDGVLQLPYPVYTPTVDRLRAAAGRFVVVFAWPDWQGHRRFEDAASIAGASPHDAMRLITRALRGERFVDGAIEGELAAGRLQAAVRRLLESAATRG